MRGPLSDELIVLSLSSLITTVDLSFGNRPRCVVGGDYVQCAPVHRAVNASHAWPGLVSVL